MIFIFKEPGTPAIFDHEPRLGAIMLTRDERAFLAQLATTYGIPTQREVERTELSSGSSAGLGGSHHPDLSNFK